MRDVHITVTPPSVKQWGRLFDAAKAIKAAEPWVELSDGDLFQIIPPGWTEPIYCSIMGLLGECYGINIYPGNESFVGYLRMASASMEEPPFISASRQNCVTCYYGDREEVGKSDREVYKALELKFRGRGEWIFFRAMREGFYAWDISDEQAELSALVLEQLLIAFQQYKSDEVPVDFDKNQMVCRKYDEELGDWQTTAVDPLPVTRMFSELVIDDELYIAQLNRKKRNGAKLQMDILYLPTPIQEDKSEIPYLPQMAFIADENSGMLVSQHVLNPEEDDEADIAQDMLAKYILQHGRPRAIRVRDTWTAVHIADICKKTGIELEEGEVELLDAFLIQMLGFIGI